MICLCYSVIARIKINHFKTKFNIEMNTYNSSVLRRCNQKQEKIHNIKSTQSHFGFSTDAS